jgi:hypothetical protein
MSGFKRTVERWEKLSGILYEIQNDSRQLSKMATTLAREGREALDQLGGVEYYLRFIERYGSQIDMDDAGIVQEEEE